MARPAMKAVRPPTDSSPRCLEPVRPLSQPANMLHMSVALLHLNGFVPGSLIARSSVPVLSKSHSMCSIHDLHRLYCNFVRRPRWPRVFQKAGPATALPYQHPPERPAGVGHTAWGSCAALNHIEYGKSGHPNHRYSSRARPTTFVAPSVGDKRRTAPVAVCATTS